ncbi:MAG: hypothetical protein K2M46_12760, partial [Lachnospiraceae bacterium]|nr:hypothetical protein [Lachnospiraceae bacterium]
LITLGNGSLPVISTFSYGLCSKCTDLLNSYVYSTFFFNLHKDKNNSSILYYTIRWNFAIRNFPILVEKHVKERGFYVLYPRKT